MKLFLFPPRAPAAAPDPNLAGGGCNPRATGGAPPRGIQRDIGAACGRCFAAVFHRAGFGAEPPRSP